jgi:hypothetical protein
MLEEIQEYILNLKIIDLILIFGASYLIGRFSKSFMLAKEISNNFKKTIEELEENKCKGPHNWIDMYVQSEKTHVCKDCYWCPKHEKFIRKHFVDAEVHRITFQEGLDKYREEVLLEMVEYYGIDLDTLQKIEEELLSIKKDYTVEFIDKKLKESEINDETIKQDLWKGK